MNLKSAALSSYFCKLSTLSHIAEQLSLQPPPSLLTFMNTIVIATKHDNELLPELVNPGKCSFTCGDILDRSIERLLELKRNNVLCLGFSLIREGYKRICIAGSNRVQIKAPNTTVMYLKTRIWKDVHALLGDEVMVHILQNVSMFVGIQSGCYIQLCGVPLQDEGLSQCPTPSLCGFIHEKEKKKVTKKRRRQNSNPSLQPVTKRRKLDENTQQTNSQSNLRVRRKTPKPDPTDTKPMTNPSKKKTGLIHEIESSFLKRSKMFYSKTLLQKFSPSHILNKNEATAKGVYNVLNSIYKFSNRPEKIQRLPKHLIHTKNLFKTLITNFKQLKVRRLLNFYSPLPKWIIGQHLRAGGGPRYKVSYEHTVRAFTPVRQVYLLTRKVLSTVIPPLLWGSEKNKKSLLKAVFKFLTLRRYERLTLRNVMKGVKTSHFTCFDQTTEGRRTAQYALKKEKLVQTFIQWVINELLIPFLKACFYITETGSHRNKVFYYRKPVWSVLRRIGMKPLLGTLFRTVNRPTLNEMLSSKRCIGVHDIRFIPSQKKVRAIANLTKSHMVIRPNSTTNGPTLQRNKTINTELRPLHLALCYESFFKRSLLGVGVTRPDQIYEKWLDFVNKCKSQYKCVPKLYAISLDIKRCFDTLPQDRILKLIVEILKEDSYVVKKFVKIKNSQNGCVTKKFVSLATDGFDCTNFVSFIQEQLKSGRLVGRNVIFVDKVYYRSESRDTLLSLATKHIKCSIGNASDRYLLQQTGIAQGSILATTLNNIHYGDIETKYLVSTYQTAESFFIRWVDDYFFVTTSLQLARKFLNNMNRNMPNYGAHLNLDKLSVNFKISSQSSSFERCQGDWFTWCGYLFNLQTMECSYNYIQYIGESIKDGMTFQYGPHRGLSMAKQLVLAVTVKATPLIIDENINSLSNAHKNVYQVFRFAALKFLTHAHALKKDQGLNIIFCFRTIKKLALKFHKRLQQNYQKHRERKHHQEECVRSGHSMTLQRIKALCYQAFVDELRRRQTGYMRLIGLLIFELKMLKGHMVDVDLCDIRERSQYFKMIKL